MYKHTNYTSAHFWLSWHIFNRQANLITLPKGRHVGVAVWDGVLLGRRLIEPRAPRLVVGRHLVQDSGKVWQR